MDQAVSAMRQGAIGIAEITVRGSRRAISYLAPQVSNILTNLSVLHMKLRNFRKSISKRLELIDERKGFRDRSIIKLT